MIIFPLAACAYLFVLDYKTDSIIQATLRHQMSADVTIITVAHRLQTIMDADKIVSSIVIISFSSPTFYWAWTVDGAWWWSDRESIFLQTKIRRFLTTFQAEFDSPKALLRKTDSLLKSMVDGSGDKDALYAVAGFDVW